MQVPIPIIGQAYKHRSLDLSAQTCKNMWPEFNKETNDVISLQPFPGLTLVSSGVTGADGGMFKYNGIGYKVTGTKLYSVNSVFTQTEIGTISGSGLCTFAIVGEQLVIVRSGNVYSYDGTTLTKGTDADFESPEFVAAINGQAIYDGEGQRFYVSDAELPLTINGLNFGSKESRGDDLVMPYVFNETVYLFGEHSLMQWWNSGVGNPPFDPIQNGTLDVGVLNGHTVASNDTYMYFLGDDYIVYRTQGGSNLEPVSTYPLSEDFRNYGSTNAHAFCFEFAGQYFYYLRFPGQKTWCYCQQSGGWFELTTDLSEDQYNVSSFIDLYGYQLFAIGGDIYKLDTESNYNGTKQIIRERVTSPISAGVFRKGLAGKKITVNDVELVVKTYAPLTGQGSIPTVMFGWAPDGRIFKERMLTANQQGNYTFRLKTSNLGSGYEWSFRIRVSDPVRFSILSSNARIEVGI